MGKSELVSVMRFYELEQKVKRLTDLLNSHGDPEKTKLVHQRVRREEFERIKNLATSVTRQFGFEEPGRECTSYLRDELEEYLESIKPMLDLGAEPETDAGR